MKKYDIKKATNELLNGQSYEPLLFVGKDGLQPETVKSFDNLQAAIDEIKKKQYALEIHGSLSNGFYIEAYIEEYEADEDGEFFEGSDFYSREQFFEQEK